MTQLKFKTSVVLVGFSLVLFIGLLNLCFYLLMQFLHFVGSNLEFKADFGLLTYRNELNGSEGLESLSNLQRIARGGIGGSPIVGKFNMGELGRPILLILAYHTRSKVVRM